MLLHRNDSLKGYYHNVQNTLMKLKVHSGKLKIKVKYEDQIYEKSFNNFNDLYEEEIKLKRKMEDWTPALV